MIHVSRKPWLEYLSMQGFDIFHRNYSTYHISSYNDPKSMQQLKKLHV